MLACRGSVTYRSNVRVIAVRSSAPSTPSGQLGIVEPDLTALESPFRLGAGSRITCRRIVACAGRFRARMIRRCAAPLNVGRAKRAGHSASLCATSARRR